MKMNSLSGFALLTSLVLALGVGVVAAQVKKGKTRPLTTEQLMEGIVKPHHDALKKGLEATTITDDGWKSLALSAALLNESTFTLMDDGRSPDAIWSDAATKPLRTGSADLLKAIEAKSQAQAKTAFGAMSKSCKSCHTKHKEK